MGFIKAIEAVASGQLKDSFREVIRYENKDKNLIIKKVSTENGIISNESRLFVEPGQCAVYTDNGAIKDIIRIIITKFKTINRTSKIFFFIQQL